MRPGPLGGAAAATLLIGSTAGLCPALRAVRDPTAWPPHDHVPAVPYAPPERPTPSGCCTWTPLPSGGRSRLPAGTQRGADHVAPRPPTSCPCSVARKGGPHRVPSPATRSPRVA